MPSRGKTAPKPGALSAAGPLAWEPAQCRSENGRTEKMTRQANITANAALLFEALERRTRPDGTQFYALKDGSPDWLPEAVHAAHGDMMPDDWRYATIRNLCSALSEDRDDLEDARSEIVDGEVDVSTASLTAWLASSVHRLAYCDQAAEEFGKPEDMSKALMLGQYAEIDETFGLLVEALAEGGE